MPKQHIIELDSLRGVMALIVAVFHFTAPNHFISGSLAVDFFFILSGVVLQKAYFDKNVNISGKDFFRKRLTRLYPLHLFALLVIVLLSLGTVFFQNYPRAESLAEAFAWHFPSDFYKDGILFTFLQQLLFINGLGFHPHGQYWNGASWSVSVELWVNMIFFLWLRKFSTELLLLISFICYSILFIQFHRLDVHTEDVLYINAGVIRCFAGFLVGIIIYRLLHSFEYIGRKQKLYSVLQMGSLFLFASILLRKEANYNDFLAIFPIVILIVVPILGLDTILNRILRYPLLNFLGKISYSIYLMHYSVQYIFQNYAGLYFEPTVTGIGILGAYIAITVLVSFLSYHFIENKSAFIMGKIINLFKIDKALSRSS